MYRTTTRVQADVQRANGRERVKLRDARLAQSKAARSAHLERIACAQLAQQTRMEALCAQARPSPTLVLPSTPNEDHVQTMYV